MGGYYKYQTVTYTTVGSSTDGAFGPFTRRPLVPYSNVSSEDYYDHDYDSDYDYVPKGTVVPIATRPYGDDYKHGSPTRAYPARHDVEWHPPQKADELLTKRTTVPVTIKPYVDEYNHGSPTKAYPARDDDEWLRQTSSVRGQPQRADEFKRTTVPVATRPDGGDEYKRSSPTKPFQPSDDDERHRQTRRPQRDHDEFLSRKTGVPVATTPYGGHEYKHVSPARIEAYSARDDDKWHPQNSSVYGRPQKADELLTKKSMAPVATRPYGPESERSSPSTDAYPARDDQKWHYPQQHQPLISPDWRRSTVNNDNYSNKEENKPIDSSAVGNDDKYGRRYQQLAEDKRSAMQKPPNGNNKPIINASWSSLPRNGNQVSGPTNDIDKLVQMLKKATLEADGNEGPQPAANSYAFPNDNYNNNFERRKVGADGPTRTLPTINSMEAEKKYKGARV